MVKFSTTVVVGMDSVGKINGLQEKLLKNYKRFIENLAEN